MLKTESTGSTFLCIQQSDGVPDKRNFGHLCKSFNDDEHLAMRNFLFLLIDLNIPVFNIHSEQGQSALHNESFKCLKAVAIPMFLLSLLGVHSPSFYFNHLMPGFLLCV